MDVRLWKEIKDTDNLGTLNERHPELNCPDIAGWSELTEPEKLLAFMCISGAYYAGTTEPEKTVLRHNIYNQDRIVDFLLPLQNKENLRVLILGPGPGQDLPLAWLVENFKEIILIDGITSPMENYKKLIPLYSQEKVLIVQQDLTGGFYQFFTDNREKIADSLKKDFNYFLKNKYPSFINYKRLLDDSEFALDLNIYKPDIIISSLVTSQLSIFDFEAHMFAKNQLMSLSKSTPNLLEEDSIFMGALAYFNKVKAQQTYLNAISDCDNAKRIFYADTPYVYYDNPGKPRREKVDSNVFQRSFLKKMSKKYFLTCIDNIWMYRHNVPVDIYEFQLAN